MTSSHSERSRSGISVVLPAYNEEENIERAVRWALEVLAGVTDDYEVIVVNDGSSDGTLDVVRRIARAHEPYVRVLSHPVNRGYGAALRTAFLRSRHELVFYTDADNQFDISEIAYMLPRMAECDMVVGFRVYRYDTVLRSLLSWGYNRLVRVLFRVSVRDVDCSFKLMRREVIDKLIIESDDFFVDTELVARARRWNFRIAEMGVRHYPRAAGRTSVRPSDVPGTLRTVARMWQHIYFPTRRQLDAASRRQTEAADATEEPVPVADS